MAEEKAGNLALKLSVEVLKREISFDEGLVRAQACQSVGPFVEGLNILVGRDLFDMNIAKQRLRSGAAERANQGEEDPLELPPELDGWTFDSDKTKPPLNEESFGPLEIQAQKCASEINEIKSRARLIEMLMEEEETISNPWIAPAIFLVLTVIATLIAHFAMHSILGALLALSLGSIASLSVFQKEVKRYGSECRRIQLELKKRSETKAKCLREIAECNERLQALRSKAEEAVESSEPLPEEEFQDFRARYPHLFQ